MIKLNYTSWISQRLQKQSDQFDLPVHVLTINDLLDWLCQLGEPYSQTFQHKSVIYAAQNGVNIGHDDKIGIGQEITLFAPIAGG